MQTFVIGDVHGYSTALSSLLAAIPLASTDRLLFLGDYVDKGPDVSGALECLSELSTRPNTIFLRGNHDQMLLNGLHDRVEFELWRSMAGRSPLSSYGSGLEDHVIRLIPEKHVSFLRETCVNHFEDESFIYVHGGLRSNRKPEEESLDYLHWMTLGMANAHESGRTVICGHSAQKNGIIADLGHTICVDTGVAFGQYLTCLEVGSMCYWQASPTGTLRKGALRPAS